MRASDYRKLGDQKGKGRERKVTNMLLKTLDSTAASEINSLHREICLLGKMALEKAVRIGELLTRKKDSLKHGQWLPWVKANIEFSDQTARNYIRVYGLRDDPKFKTVLNLSDAYALMDGQSEGVHFSSNSDEWETPQDLFDEIDSEFRFEVDVCALPSSAKCSNYFTPEVDGLSQDWERKRCWMNPPYGDISKWIAKAYSEAQKGATTVCLVPARVDTNWWWDYCRFAEIRFLKGRLKFGQSNTSAPFPSVVVIFGPKIGATIKWWERGSCR